MIYDSALSPPNRIYVTPSVTSTTTAAISILTLSLLVSFAFCLFPLKVIPVRCNLKLYGKSVIPASSYDRSEAGVMWRLLPHNTDTRQSQLQFMVGWMWTCTQVDTHMHRIVSNWINTQTKALQMQVIAYSLFHKECARWIKHLWINTHIDLNVTLWIHFRLLLRFRILTFPLPIIPQSLTLAYFFISLFPFHLFAIWEKWIRLLPSCIQPEDINWPNANKWAPLILNVSH